MRDVFPGGIDDGGDGIGEKNFFHHADGEEGPADVEPTGAIGVIDIFEVRFYLPETHDGTGDELRKKADITGKLPEVACGGNDAAVGINHVADGVKGVERNSDG
jgi:hypothetical protein